MCDCVILIIEGEMKQLIIIIGHHSKLIRTKVDAIAIDYQYIFHGILASDLTTTPEHREGSNFPSLLGRNVLKGNSKKCNPQRFYCDTRNFYSPELFSTNSHDRVRKFG